MKDKTCVRCGEVMKGIKDYSKRTHCIDIECQQEYEQNEAWRKFTEELGEGE